VVATAIAHGLAAVATTHGLATVATTCPTDTPSEPKFQALGTQRLRIGNLNFDAKIPENAIFGAKPRPFSHRGNPDRVGKSRGFPFPAGAKPDEF